MFKLSFTFSHEYEPSDILFDMIDWMKENDCKSVTIDTLIENNCEDIPKRFFRIRQTSQSGRDHVISASHHDILTLFKLRFSDYWETSKAL